MYANFRNQAITLFDTCRPPLHGIEFPGHRRPFIASAATLPSFRDARAKSIPGQGDSPKSNLTYRAAFRVTTMGAPLRPAWKSARIGLNTSADLQTGPELQSVTLQSKIPADANRIQSS
jgi:hypothetical protein